MGEPPLLSVEGLRVEFHSDAGTLKAVDGIDLVIQRGETLALVGESGCGKSMTALAIMGLVPEPPGHVAAGQIRFGGIDLIGPQRVRDFIHDIAAVEGVEDAEEEIEIHLQAGFGVGLGESAGLLEQEHSEAVETRIQQRQAILGLIHAEAARPTGAGGEETMTLYFIVKYLHVLVAIVIPGTGSGIAFLMLMAHRSHDAAFVALLTLDSR